MDRYRGEEQRTKAEAKAYRAALLAYRQSPNRWLLMSIERLRRSATITYGHNRSSNEGVIAMNTDTRKITFSEDQWRDPSLCTQCKRDATRFPAGQLYVEWSNWETIEENGCVAEMFCSWDCAARWFSRGRPRKATQAGLDLPSQQ